MTASRYALGYLRTSSQANFGEDKDSERLQPVAIECRAARKGYTVVEWFYDGDDVRGDVEIADHRPRDRNRQAVQRIAG
jgi:DNA invertase Pin-like site-specific DNA recombinase